MVTHTELLQHRLTDEGFINVEKIQIELRWVTAAESKKLNQQFRKKDHSTDVLSFPLYTHAELEDLKQQTSETPILLGSLALCKEVIADHALEAGRSIDDQITWSLEHGLKHLLGLDHNPHGTTWFPVTTPKKLQS